MHYYNVVLKHKHQLLELKGHAFVLEFFQIAAKTLVIGTVSSWEVVGQHSFKAMPLMFRRLGLQRTGATIN